MHLYVHCSIIYNSQDMEAAQVSINKLLDKEIVHIYTGILLSHKKRMKSCTCGNMDGLYLLSMLSEVSQREKDKYHVISLTCEI